MRRVRATIVHGQMHTIANAVRERRHIQLAYFVLDPPSISIALWLSYLDLSCHRLSCVRLLLFHTVRIVLGLEAAEVHLYIPLCHGKAGMPKKLFDGVNINTLFNHVILLMQVYLCEERYNQFNALHKREHEYSITTKVHLLSAIVTYGALRVLQR
jgi:hypothetical protein